MEWLRREPVTRLPPRPSYFDESRIGKGSQVLADRLGHPRSDAMARRVLPWTMKPPAGPSSVAQTGLVVLSLGLLTAFAVTTSALATWSFRAHQRTL